MIKDNYIKKAKTKIFETLIGTAFVLILVYCKNSTPRFEDNAIPQYGKPVSEKVKINNINENIFIENCNKKLVFAEKFFQKYWYQMSEKEFKYVTERLVNDSLLKFDNSTGDVEFIFYFEQVNYRSNIQRLNFIGYDSICSLIKGNFLNDSLISLQLELQPIWSTPTVENGSFKSSIRLYPHIEKLFELYNQKYGTAIKTKTFQYLCLDIEKPYKVIPYKVHTGYEYKWQTDQGYILIKEVLAIVNTYIVINPLLPLFKDEDNPIELTIEYLSPKGYSIYNAENQSNEYKLAKILKEIEDDNRSRASSTKKSI